MAITYPYFDPLSAQRTGTTFLGDHLTFIAGGGVLGQTAACIGTDAVTTNIDGWLFPLTHTDTITAGVFYKSGISLVDLSGSRKRKDILGFYAGSGNNNDQRLARIVQGVDGRLSIEVDNSSIGRTSTYQTIYTDNWYFVEFSIRLTVIAGPSTTVECTVRLNDNEVFSSSGSITGSFDSCNLLRIAGVSEADNSDGDFYTDLYVNSGFENWQGEGQVFTLRPSANGSSQDWTPNTGVDHYAVIDETTQDGDTTYLESSTYDDEEMNAHENLSGSPTILGVSVSVVAKKTVGGDDSVIVVGAREGGTNRYSATELEPALDSYGLFAAGFLTNPATLAAWTPAEVNADEFGFKHLQT